MRRYFFHIHNGNGFTQDEEGRALPSLAAARREAVTGIRSLLIDELEQGLINLQGRLDICDPKGSVLLSLPFSEAVEVRCPQQESQ
jgi:hypothetical protein